MLHFIDQQTLGQTPLGKRYYREYKLEFVGRKFIQPCKWLREEKNTHTGWIRTALTIVSMVCVPFAILGDILTEMGERRNPGYGTLADLDFTLSVQSFDVPFDRLNIKEYLPFLPSFLKVEIPYLKGPSPDVETSMLLVAENCNETSKEAREIVKQFSILASEIPSKEESDERFEKMQKNLHTFCKDLPQKKVQPYFLEMEARWKAIEKQIEPLRAQVIKLQDAYR